MIIDNVQDIDSLKGRTLFLYPVPKDNRLHPITNAIIAFVLIDLNTRETFTLSNGHPEGMIRLSDISFLKHCTVYAYNCNLLMYANYDVSSFIDVQMQYYLYTNKGVDTPTHPSVSHFQRLYNNCFSTNELVSLLKHEEIAHSILEAAWVKDLQPGISFYQSNLVSALHLVEKNGIKVDSEGFSARFGKTPSLINGRCFTQYNFFTATGRPSNRFGGINYAALNKEDSTRENFLPSSKDGLLVEVDFNSYHPRLIGQIVGYDFGTNNVYKHLAEYYYRTSNPSEEQINSAKEDTFRQIYGGIQSQYLEVPFFSMISNMVKYLWNKANDEGFIESPISGRRLWLHNLGETNPYTLFNYFIQMYETETNALVLGQIHDLLKDCTSKPVLYTYDSILFDVERKELDYLLGGVLKRSIDQEKFPIKIKGGINYKDLRGFL